MIQVLKRFAVFILYTLLFVLVIVALFVWLISHLVFGFNFMEWFSEKFLFPVDAWIDTKLNDGKGAKRKADDLTSGPFPGK